MASASFTALRSANSSFQSRFTDSSPESDVIEKTRHEIGSPFCSRAHDQLTLKSTWVREGRRTHRCGRPNRMLLDMRRQSPGSGYEDWRRLCQAGLVPSRPFETGGGADALALPPPPWCGSSGGGAFLARSATGHARPRWTRTAAPRRDRIRDGGGLVLFHSSLIPLQLAGLSMMPMLVWAIFWLERDW